LYLLPDKAIYWPAQKALLVADVHLGKAGHFRKAGIPVSGRVHFSDLQKLSELVQAYQPEQLIILGDLFHSTLNNEWTHFSQWMDEHPDCKIVLIKGNHDILPPSVYTSERIYYYEHYMVMEPFVFSHIPMETRPSHYNLSGHLHPAVRLSGRGSQHLILPCFYFGSQQGLLPAFGAFTGAVPLKIYPGDAVFAILNDKVRCVSK
jgi:DNA ligase-associated metallophosphoesterase